MPRTERVVPEDGVLHIIGRGNNKRALFRKERDFKYFVNLIKEYKERYSCVIYHYVLMKNHVHMVVGVIPNSNLSKMMHGIGLRYAAHYKRVYPHVGHFWQDRFKSFVINNDEYLMRCGLYIESNPVRAGLVRSPEGYRWSSYNFYAFGQKNTVLTQDPFYRDIGRTAEERMSSYQIMMKESMINSVAGKHVTVTPLA